MLCVVGGKSCVVSKVVVPKHAESRIFPMEIFLS